MDEFTGNTEISYLKLKRASTLGFIAVLVWFSIVAGAMFLVSGDSLGWLSILIGIVILALPFTNPFRRYWETGNSARVFPVLIFAANIGLIIIYGSVLLALLSDPFVFYNDQNTFEVILWAGATFISVFALLVNIGALIIDRRQIAQEPA